MAKRKKAKSGGKKSAGGGKTRTFGASARAMASGGAAFVAHDMLARALPSVAGHPIGGPGAMLVVGHLVKRKFPVAGAAICGASGYAFGSAMRLTNFMGIGGRDAQGLQDAQLGQGDTGHVTAEDLFENLETVHA